MLAEFAGLDLLDNAVVLLDARMCVIDLNSAAEQMFDVSRRTAVGQCFDKLVLSAGGVLAAARLAVDDHTLVTEHELELVIHGGAILHLACQVVPLDLPQVRALCEFRTLDQQLRRANEDRMLAQQQANRELIRNLAHEVKNPLGGIRGAAQLLERELERVDLHEYTQVITQEASRLQSLMDRMLAPHRLPHVAPLNIHEVLERVRSLLLAETPTGLLIRRDYDTSLPLLHGDKEQLIQVVLNVARNAVQAMQGQGEVVLQTRVARQVTIARKRHALAVRLEISDNGPGIPVQIQDRLFYPLVTGRAGGHGLGLMLVQNYVHQHSGMIEFESQPGRTVFRIVLPLGKDVYREPGKA